MNVVVTVPSLRREFGGPVVKATRLVSALGAAGQSVQLAGAGQSANAISLGTTTRFHATPVPRYLKPLYEAIDRSDVLHVIGYRDPVGTFAALRARRKGIPYVLEPVGMYGPKLRSSRIKLIFERFFGRRVVASAASVIATSVIERDELIMAGINEDRIVLRPNGLSVDDLLPLPSRGNFRAEHNIPAEARLILTISRLSLTKGLAGLVEAVSRLDGAYLVIAGPDDRDGTRSSLLSVSRRLDFDPRFRLLDRGVWEGEKAAALADADCFCLPSQTESFGLAAAEAAAVGLPVVLSDRCGVAEWLDEGSIHSYPYGHVDSLMIKLQNVLGNPEVARAASQGAAPLRERLSWASVSREQMKIYEAALVKRVL